MPSIFPACSMTRPYCTFTRGVGARSLRFTGSAGGRGRFDCRTLAGVGAFLVAAAEAFQKPGFMAGHQPRIRQTDGENALAMPGQALARQSANRISFPMIGERAVRNSRTFTHPRQPPVGDQRHGVVLNGGNLPLKDNFQGFRGIRDARENPTSTSRSGCSSNS